MLNALHTGSVSQIMKAEISPIYISADTLICCWHPCLEFYDMHGVLPNAYSLQCRHHDIQASELKGLSALSCFTECLMVHKSLSCSFYSSETYILLYSRVLSNLAGDFGVLLVPYITKPTYY